MVIAEHVDIKKLGNQELLEQTHQLVKEERRIGTLILNRLKEISRRRLYNSLGYSSTFTYLVQELKYSEACAFRLNNAMKILAELPEVEAKIQSGVLSVTTVAQVQAFCQAQKKENGLLLKTEVKKEILRQVEGASKRNVEKILVSLYPNSPLPTRDSQEPVAPNRTEIKFEASDVLIQKLERIKSLTAHRILNPSYADLLDLMAEEVLNKIDPTRKAERLENRHKKDDSKSSVDPIRPSDPKDGTLSETAPRTTAASTQVKTDPSQARVLSPGEGVSKHRIWTPQKKMSRYIPAKVKAAVWARDQGQCSYVSPQGKRRCGEKSGLQFEHRIPIAKGGTHDVENVELLCRSHNISAAFDQFGAKKMSRFVNTSV